VSEADLPKTPEAAALPAPEASPVEPPRPAEAPARSGRGLAGLALLLALAAGGAAGWSLWQQYQLNPQAATDGLAETLQAERAAVEQLGKRLQAVEQIQAGHAGLQEALTDLQSRQQLQGQQLERLFGEGRKELRLAEAEHLLRLASLRLAALQDVEAAEALLAGADEVLREQNDPAAFAARRELGRALEALRSRPQPDRTGLYLSLAALREESRGITDEAPSYAAPEVAADPQASHWERWAQKLSGYVRIELDAEQQIRPLLSGQALEQVRLALSLSLEHAQWAVLNGEEAVYRQALAQAREILQSQFNPDRAAVAGLLARLDELSKQPVSYAAPDISSALKAFQAYLAQRGTVAGEAAEAETRP